MRNLTLLAALLALAACGKDKKKDEAAPSATKKVHSEDDNQIGPRHTSPPARTGDPRPQPKLTASVDGQPVAMTAAFAWAQPDGSLSLLVSNVPATCEWATGDMRELADGEQDWSAELGKHLAPDGTIGWAVRQVSYGANTQAGDVGPAQVAGAGEPGQSTTIGLAFEQKSAGFGDRPVQTLKVDGTVDALGCPPPKPRGDAPPPPAEQAGSLTVAGQKLAIRGAAIQQDASGEREIVLSSGGVSCGSFVMPDHAALAVTLHYKATGDDAWQTDLTGDWIGGQQATQIFDQGKLVAAPPKVDAGATSVELALSGTLDIMGYPVALEGKVTAQVCPTK